MYFNPIRAYNPYIQSKNVNSAKTSPSFGNIQKIHTLKEILDEVKNLPINKDHKNIILNLIGSHVSHNTKPILYGIAELEDAATNNPKIKQNIKAVLIKMKNSEIVKNNPVYGEGLANNIQRSINEIADL